MSSRRCGSPTLGSGMVRVSAVSRAVAGAAFAGAGATVEPAAASVDWLVNWPGEAATNANAANTAKQDAHRRHSRRKGMRSSCVMMASPPDPPMLDTGDRQESSGRPPRTTVARRSQSEIALRHFYYVVGLDRRGR